MDLIKYKGKVIISRIDSTTGIPLAEDTVMQNSGTSNLWYLLCQLLLIGASGGGLDIPRAIDIGYFDVAISEELFSQKPSEYEGEGVERSPKFHSIIASSGNLFVDKRVVTSNDTGSEDYYVPVLEVTSYFFQYSFTTTDATKISEAKSNLCIVLKDNTINGHILAVVDTGSKSYEILENETQIIKWQLSFQNVMPKTES